MVHRDIKPQNVLIDAEGRAKLTDFGISRQLEQDGMTATGRVLGTTDYVAPEQAMGQAVDPRSDIYSLGVVLYEMLVGEVPFHADSQVGVAMKHVNEELPDVQRRRPEVSAAVALVVERATAKDPAERYQHVGEMIDDLETALEVEAARAGSTTGEATSVLDAVPPPKRKLSAAAALVLGGDRRCSLVAGGRPGRGPADLERLVDGGRRRGGDGGQASGAPVTTHRGDRLRPRRATARRSDEVELAVDGNPTGTAWATEHYDTPDLRRDQDRPDPGVVRLRHEPARATARGDERQHADPGLGRRGLRRRAVAARRPRGLGRAGRPRSTTPTSARQVSLDTAGQPSDYYLLWFTKLDARPATSATRSRSPTIKPRSADRLP